MPKDVFFGKGWHLFSHDTRLTKWIDHTLDAARATVADPDLAEWHRCSGTWFVGVNALANDTSGSVNSGVPLECDATDFIHDVLRFSKHEFDRAQVSVCYSGYPGPTPGESEAALRYRIKRDAAHVDGVLRAGPDKRRYLREHHAYILGIPMVRASPQAAPFVIWEGSHELVREAMMNWFHEMPPSSWRDLDITDQYNDLRKQIFDTCKRVQVSAKPGEAYIAHRLSLHGMAPWGPKANASKDGRMICYFRPQILSPYSWLNDP